MQSVEKCRYEVCYWERGRLKEIPTASTDSFSIDQSLEEAAAVTINIYMDCLMKLVKTYRFKIYIHPVVPVLNETRSDQAVLSVSCPLMFTVHFVLFKDTLSSCSIRF